MSDTCPECGKELSLHEPLDDHKGSKSCQYFQDKQRRKETGLVSPVSTTTDASQVALEYLDDHDYPYEELLHRSHEKQYYTTEEAKQALRKDVLINPPNNGFHAKILKQPNESILVCQTTKSNPRFIDNPDNIFIVQIKRDRDMSRKRTVYLRLEDNVAFTSDGRRIGPSYNFEQANLNDVVDPDEIVANLV